MDRTDIVIVLDRSGSMQSHRADHEGGLRSFVEDQRRLAGDVRLTFVRFDSEEPFELVYDRTPLESVEIEKLSLIPRGGTPLIAAVHKTLAHLEPDLASEPKHPVVVMVITDGEENASGPEYSKADLRKRLLDWQAQDRVVLYLGANVDAFAEAGSLGVGLGNTVLFSARGAQGATGPVRGMYKSFSGTVAAARQVYAQTGELTVANCSYEVTAETRQAAQTGLTLKQIEALDALMAKNILRKASDTTKEDA